MRCRRDFTPAGWRWTDSSGLLLRLFFLPVVCLCSEAMLELALVSAVTHLQLDGYKTPKCRRWESPGFPSDLSASWVEMKVGGLCRRVLLQHAFHLFIQFVIFVFDSQLWESGIEAETQQRKSVTQCQRVLTSTTSASEGRVVLCRDEGLQENMLWRMLRGVYVTFFLQNLQFAYPGVFSHLKRVSKTSKWHLD